MIDRLEENIREFRIEFQRFFNGESNVPPEAQAELIRRQLSQLNGIPQLTSVEQFRLGGIESRYNSLSELFRRRLRDMDHSQRARIAKPAPGGESTSVILDPRAGTEDVATLYEALYAEKRSNVALEDFHAYLLDQASKVRKRTGCSRVRFTVRSEQGKRRLKARPMPTEGDA